ncbi:MAG: ribosomal protein L11 methyltransferase, partial [Planctomycetota bacterium]
AAPELEGLTASFRCLPPEEYASSWRKSWKPFRVGKLCVLPTWYEGKLRADDLRMTLEPGGSFGSGRHATTRTCLRVLGERVKGGETVLDAGSGSGILAVAATLFGAGRALGFDIDPNSKMYGDDLARQNKVSDRVTFRTGDFSVLSDQDQDFDFVLANIYSDVIQSEVRNLMDRLALGGCFMFSGCPQHHRDNTRRAILNAGLVIEEERQRGRWITFVGLNSQTQA